MPYMNKRNRFVAAAKQLADNSPILQGDYSAFTKTDLLQIAQSIGMKGIPTWVLKEHRSTVSKGLYDLTSLVAPAPMTQV
jgi:hypothetical protein